MSRGADEIERRMNYWRDPPSIDSVTFLIITDVAVAWKALLRGELDVSSVTNETWWRERANPAVNKQLTFISTWLPAYNCFAWNVGDPLFREVDIRLAMAMSFDSQAVIAQVYHGQARRVTARSSDQWAYNDAVRPVQFDLPQAAATLAAAGWLDKNHDGILERHGQSFAFTLLIPSSDVARDQAQILQNALRQLGVQACYLSRVAHATRK